MRKPIARMAQNRALVSTEVSVALSHEDYTSQSGTLLMCCPDAAVFTILGVAGWHLGSHLVSKPVTMDGAIVQRSSERADTTSTTPLDRSLKPSHDVSVANLRRARERIVAVVGEENIDSRLDEIERHTGPQWSSHPGSPDEAPAAIVRPESTEQVSEIMRVCHDLRIPVVAFSGGTSLEGHFANTRRGITLDLGRMNKILASHKNDLDVVVQPGVGYEELNEALAKQVSASNLGMTTTKTNADSREHLV